MTSRLKPFTEHKEILTSVDWLGQLQGYTSVYSSPADRFVSGPFEKTVVIPYQDYILFRTVADWVVLGPRPGFLCCFTAFSMPSSTPNGAVP